MPIFEMRKKEKTLVHIWEFLKSSISLDIPIRPAQTLKLYLVWLFFFNKSREYSQRVEREEIGF